MDAKVLQIQNWLNKTYKNNTEYTQITADGVTGWNTVKALTKALQIELGVTADGDFGPATKKAFKNLSTAYKPARQITILQGALYCKGYNPGGYSSNYTASNVKAIQKLKADAGLTDTSSVVNANLMKALLTMDAFILLNYGEFHGDSNIRTIQQSLNRNYSSNQYFANGIGLVPCDGIYGRSTNKALLYALQIEGNISAPDGIWGPQTKSVCPTLSVGSTKSKFIYLLQYALYCNGYDPNGFDGQYGNGIKTAVTNFQKFYCLDADGIAGPQTWCSLLVSTGDTSRKGTMCDCATTITAAKAKTLIANGYKSIGRYLTGKFKMTSSELKIIFNAGLRVFPIFETGGYKLEYFSAYQGNIDAKSAIAAAHNFGFDTGTIIYFTVDFDALDGDVTSSILPYFSEIYQVFKRTKTTYKIGIYAPRNVCSRVSEAGLSCSSFVCDMSSGFSGNLGYPLPKDWAIDQISTITIGTGDGQIEIDNNISSGKDMGVSKVVPGNNANGIIDLTPEPEPPISIDNSNIPENGLECIVLCGQEGGEDAGRYKYNFINTSFRKINEYLNLRYKLPANSKELKNSITLLIDKLSYSDDDIKNLQISVSALEYVNLVFVSTKQELINYFNTGSLSGTGARKQKIKEITVFWHGKVGALLFGKDYNFEIADINKIDKLMFYNLKSVFYSCNTGTGDRDSFAYRWKEHLGGNVQACVNKTDYENICTQTDAERAAFMIARNTYPYYLPNGSYHYPVPTRENPVGYWVFF